MTGAFVAGVMVSATDYAERTIHQLEPIRNLFAALFLASIGLIMNPIFLWTHMDVLFASVLVVIVTKVKRPRSTADVSSLPPALACSAWPFCRSVSLGRLTIRLRRQRRAHNNSSGDATLANSHTHTPHSKR